MRKMTVLLLILSLAGAMTAAGAESLTSQFGFSGWPVCPPVTDKNDVIPTQEPESDPVMGCFPTREPLSFPETHPIPTVKPSVPTVRPTAPAATPTPVTGHGDAVAGSDYTTYSPTMQEANAWNLLNSDRLANGLAALTLDPELCRIARIKSEDMRDHHYFAHESPTWGKMDRMLRSFGYSFNACGENIAHHATIERAETAFMSSAAHRRNILMKSWTRVGIGVCLDANGYVYETQVFAR